MYLKPFQSDNSRLKCLLQQQSIVRVWRLGSDLITPRRYVYMRYWGVMIKYSPPRRSLQVDAGVVVGLKEQAATEAGQQWHGQVRGRGGDIWQLK